MHSAVSSSKRRARLPSQARGVLLALCIFTSLLSLITAVRADAQSQFRLKAPSRQNWSSDDAGVGPAAADAFDSHPGHGYLTSSFDSPASRNLIDILAESEEHTVFVRLLQRARLLPTLNLLQASDDGRGLTILAPTNDAIARKADEESRARKSSIAQQQLKQGAYNIERASKALGMWEWAIELSRLPTPPPSGDDHEYDQAGYIWSGRQGAPNLLENINAALRQQLLYHILNYTLPYNTSSATASESSRPSQPALHETLHLPSRKLLKEPTRPGPIPHPPEGPPHPGAEDQGGLLGGEGQKLRISWRTIGKGDFAAGGDNGEWANTARKEGALFFGTDAQGKGGARGLKQDWTSNKGVVVSVDAVLELPPDLGECIFQAHVCAKAMVLSLAAYLACLVSQPQPCNLTLSYRSSPSFYRQKCSRRCQRRLISLFSYPPQLRSTRFHAPSGDTSMDGGHKLP